MIPRRSLALVGVALLSVASVASAQGSAQSHKVTGVIRVPVDLKALDPHVKAIREKCGATAPAGGGETLAFDNAIQEVKVTGGVVNTMLAFPFTISRAGDFTPGEVWQYACTFTMVTQLAGGGAVAELPPVFGGSTHGPTHLVSGVVVIGGEFTLRGGFNRSVQRSRQE